MILQGAYRKRFIIAAIQREEKKKDARPSKKGMTIKGKRRPVRRFRKDQDNAQ